MGKATRWLRVLLGMKKQKESDDNSNSGDRKEKKRWSFAKSSGRDSGVMGKIPANNPATDTAWLRSYFSETEKEQNKHAIAVAAATAAAADAAVAAAQAAVAVVRLTSQGRGSLFCCGTEKWAAVKIQAVFRGYLARKALRALKGLVKIQALVRGYLVRKRATATLHSMQALIRAQATVRSQRARRLLNKDNRFHHPEIRSRRSMERFDETRSEFHSKRLSVENPLNAYEGSPKIVEVDTYKPSRSRSRRMTTSISDSGEDLYYHTVSSSFPCPVPTRISIPDYEWSFTGEEFKCCTAQSTPRLANSGRSNVAVTPAKSVCGEGFFRPYSNCPNYMSNTQSFRAKLRSQSAPKQRPEPGSKKRLSLNEIMESRASLSGVRMQRSCAQVQEDLDF